MKTALIVVDMQNDFIDGSLGTSEAQKILPNVVDLVSNAKKDFGDDVQIIFTKDTHHENYLQTQEGKNLPVKHCLKNSAGWELADELIPFAKIILEKPTFGSKELPSVVSKLGCEKIILCGLCTDICVISNALLLKAFFPECEISVKENACAGVTPQSHRNALEAMKMCQIKII